MPHFLRKDSLNIKRQEASGIPMLTQRQKHLQLWERMWLPSRLQSSWSTLKSSSTGYQQCQSREIICRMSSAMNLLLHHRPSSTVMEPCKNYQSWAKKKLPKISLPNIWRPWAYVVAKDLGSSFGPIGCLHWYLITMTMHSQSSMVNGKKGRRFWISTCCGRDRQGSKLQKISPECIQQNCTGTVCVQLCHGERTWSAFRGAVSCFSRRLTRW